VDSNNFDLIGSDSIYTGSYYALASLKSNTSGVFLYLDAIYSLTQTLVRLNIVQIVLKDGESILDCYDLFFYNETSILIDCQSVAGNESVYDLWILFNFSE